MINVFHGEMDAEQRMEERNRQKADFDKYEPEAWKVAQLAATLCTCPFSAEVASYTIDSAVDDAQKILAAARKAVRQ